MGFWFRWARQCPVHIWVTDNMHKAGQIIHINICENVIFASVPER